MIPTLTFRHKLLLFALLNLADLLLTWQLWYQGGGQLLDEAYPIAYHYLAVYGWVGLMGFQFIGALLVGALFTIGCRFRPRISEGGLSFLCLALSSVIVYRCCLAGMPPPQDQPAHPDPLENVLSPAYVESYQSRHYRQLLHHWADEVVRRDCTLSEAARQLQESEKARNVHWLAYLRRVFGNDYSDEACLASNLLMHCASRMVNDGDLPRARRKAVLLQDEFQATYGAEAPPEFKKRISFLENADSHRARDIRPFGLPGWFKAKPSR